MSEPTAPASMPGPHAPEPSNSVELDAFDEGGRAALTALAASFAKAGDWDASNATLRALAKIAPTCPCCRAIEGVTSHSGGVSVVNTCHAEHTVGFTGKRLGRNEDGGAWEPCAHDEPWCPNHGYGCEPQNCPCGHSLRCDCVGIANDH